MDEHLIRFAQKATSDPDFFGHTLHLFAEGNALDEPQLCQRLGIDLEKLVKLKLCRTPRLDPEGFRKDTHRLGEVFGIDQKLIARIVREVRVTVGLQQTENISPKPEWSMAARDHSEEDPS